MATASARLSGRKASRPQQTRPDCQVSDLLKLCHVDNTFSNLCLKLPYKAVVSVKMAMSENKSRALRGELYYAFTPEMVNGRRRCTQACNRYNNAGEVTRRRQVELWRESVCDGTMSRTFAHLIQYRWRQVSTPGQSRNRRRRRRTLR